MFSIKCYNYIIQGGYLYTPGEDDGYIIGPIITEKFNDKDDVKELIRLILNTKKNMFKHLEVVISGNNKLLNQCYLELGWNYIRTAREMRYDIHGINKKSTQWKVDEVDKNNKNLVDDVFKVLDKAFKWNGNYEKINELLKEDYRLGCVFDEKRNIVGVVSWAYLKNVDFSRLEYLAVEEQYRKKGIGKSMINHVINDSISNNVNCIYLSTDIDNTAGNLYKTTGFYDTVVSNIYGGDL